MTKEEQGFILERLDEIYNGLCKDYKYRLVQKEAIQTDGIKILYFAVCLEPESPAYGRALGTFQYGDDIYQFHYNIHTPSSKGPHRSNQMQSIEKVVIKEYRTGGKDLKYEETAFGQRAFWMHTPMSMLNEKEQALRRLMKGLQAYVRRQKWMSKLHHLDAAHEKWESDRQAKHKQEDLK